MVLPGLSLIAIKQASATETTDKKVLQLLDYLATHPAAKVRYYASDMIINIHSDASCLTETLAQSRVAGQFFLGSIPVKGQHIVLNGSIFILYGIIKFVVASVQKLSLEPYFSTAKKAKSYTLPLKKWDTSNLRHQYIVIMSLLQELPIIL